jgi:ComF family protein
MSVANIKKAFKQLIDIIYPPRCPICQVYLFEEIVEADQVDFVFCRNCFDDFSEITSPLCAICGKPFASWVEGDHPCEDCIRKWPHYAKVVAPYLYKGSLMKAIHQFKYAGKSHLAKTLGPLLASSARKWLTELEDALVMPVPLHPKRLRERSFNQSLLLARYVARRLGFELDFLSLRRVRYTQPQTGLKKDQRRKNVRKAFDLKEPDVVKDRDIILVDDVTTTGNTLNECARVLKKSGAKNVFCTTLARTAVG